MKLNYEKKHGNEYSEMEIELSRDGKNLEIYVCLREDARHESGQDNFDVPVLDVLRLISRIK